ncbi:related to postreplication repair protein uvsH/nuvA [Sporisorium reilianum SRZ2]|uniref:Postreplication repair E3 ubiquitin-protein ligase RAD18 n=1 Tax=Sporisorium reilianum (strain SRZ2) TaxID=999809 RepID=E6ZWD3_SPORE|nr:related to postreplication repair protein uvsH/nuvA [Sporisorium reilianum SRZ2]
MQSSVATLLDDVTDPSDWQADFAILRNLDASLRCDLCFDIYTSPVSIKSCHHTFCSTCIRTHINQSGNSGSFCPKCRQTKAYDSELIPQPVLELTAIEWKKSRSFLARLQTQSQQLPPPPQPHAATTSKRPQSDVNGASPRRSKRIRTDLQPAGSRSSPLTVEDVDDDGDDLINGTDDDHDAQATTEQDDDDRDGDYIEGASAASVHPSPSKRRAVETKSSDRELKADDLVECPICRHKFTVTALNRHLDSAQCYDGFPEPSAEQRGLAPKAAKTTSSWFTKGASAASPSTSADATSSMANEKRLVRPQYNLKSERDLRKLLDDAGLPTSGDKEKMVERHRQWINIWNANLDSTKARRSAAQLRKDLAAWERTKWSAKDHSAHVDRQKTTWIKSNKSQFDDLIQKAKMGAIKDKKLRDAPASKFDNGAQPTPAAVPVEQQGPNSEHEPQVIPSSPAIPDAA